MEQSFVPFFGTVEAREGQLNRTANVNMFMCGKGGGKGWQMEQKEEEAEMVPHFPAKGSGGDASRLSWGTEQKERENCYA